MRIRVFEAFAGYGSQMMALRRVARHHAGGADFQLVGWSEIDDNAIAAHNAVFPEYAECNHGDISKVDWERVSDFDLFTYSFPCFRAGTLVYTTNGYKTIEAIRIGDMVLTHLNRFKPVTQLMEKRKKGVRVSIKTMCAETIHCTDEHPFYVRKMFKKGHKSIRCFHNAEWVNAKDLTKKHYVGYAINVKEEIPVWNGAVLHNWGHNRKVNELSSLFANPSFWYLMGRYVGDGWKRQNEHSKGVIICCGGRNREKLESAFNTVGWNAFKANERTVTKYHICSKELCAFVDRYGYYAHSKRIDSDTLNLPIPLLKSFLDGVIDSDGCRVGKLIKITSVSRELIYDIGRCVAKVYKRPFSIGKCIRPRTTYIEGRTVNQLDLYTISFKESDDKQDRAFYEDGYLWLPISSIEYSEDDYPVYNLSVEDDESYTANGVIVHNCQDISNAGLQRGLREGSGSRSSLLWECRRAIEKKRPSFLLLENVAALASKKFMPDFQRWIDYLDEQGYKTYWKKINAKDFGVPQNRVRVFAVSIRKDASAKFPQLFPSGIKYDFPQPFPLERRLRDVLVTYHDGESVEDRYYLKPDVILGRMKWNAKTTTNHKFEYTEGGGIAKTILSGGMRNDDNYIQEQ